MQDKSRSVFFAKTTQELLYQINSVAGLHVVGGCTALTTLPEKILSIRHVHELSHIDKHERYINFGAGVTLSEILDVASSRIPSIFVDAIKSIATPHVRNLATIGGNICYNENNHKLTLYAPLLALDAHIELRSPSDTILMPLVNFNGSTEGYVVTNVRVPINDWDVSIFRRIGPSHKIADTSSSFAFLAATEKNIITNIKIALAGPITFRAHEIENTMLGSHLPLSEKDVEQAIVKAARLFDSMAKGKTHRPMLRSQFLNLVRYASEQLM